MLCFQNRYRQLSELYLRGGCTTISLLMGRCFFGRTEDRKREAPLTQEVARGSDVKERSGRVSSKVTWSQVSPKPWKLISSSSSSRLGTFPHSLIYNIVLWATCTGSDGRDISRQINTVGNVRASRKGNPPNRTLPSLSCSGERPLRLCQGLDALLLH